VRKQTDFRALEPMKRYLRSKSGRQWVIPTYGKHEGVKLVGCLNYETDNVYVEEHQKYDAEVFLQFLKNVLSRYPHGKTVMILDNAKIHHAKLLKGFMKENRNRLELVFLPPFDKNQNKKIFNEKNNACNIPYRGI